MVLQHNLERRSAKTRVDIKVMLFERKLREDVVTGTVDAFGVHQQRTRIKD